jgi:hypothetical protein
MAKAHLRAVVRHLQATIGSQALAGVTDAELLGRFMCVRNEAAFAVLLRRHGPMVLAVARRVLGQLEDAEDVFQATFLLLIRKASAIRIYI